MIRCDDLEEIAVHAGSIVLENGGETYRAEETVVRTAQALGARQASAFVTPTVVMFSYIDDNGTHHTNMRRIYRRGTNLTKVSLINNLSRRLELKRRASDPQQIKKFLVVVDAIKGYPPFVIILAAACSSLCFTLMFGGRLSDGFCAFCIGFLLRIILLKLDKITQNSFMVSLTSGAFISVMAVLAGLSGAGKNASIIMTGTLMQVVPGLALVNSIRDIIAGDLMSGTARLVDAVIIAAGLSVGVVAGMLVARFV
jgi:uncharacterized membrane protein YjjP (DUF1212 family)